MQHPFLHQNLWNTTFRSPAWSDNPELRDWIDLNDVGAHLGHSVGYDLRVYKKDMDRGLQKLDDTAGLYLFESEPLHLGISIQFKSLLASLYFVRHEDLNYPDSFSFFTSSWRYSAASALKTSPLYKAAYSKQSFSCGHRFIQ